MAINKLCPFCDQDFNIEVLKGHIVKAHIGLGKLVDFMNNEPSDIVEEPERVEPEESLHIKVKSANTFDPNLQIDIKNKMNEAQINDSTVSNESQANIDTESPEFASLQDLANKLNSIKMTVLKLQAVEMQPVVTLDKTKCEKLLSDKNCLENDLVQKEFETKPKAVFNKDESQVQIIIKKSNITNNEFDQHDKRFSYLHPYSLKRCRKKVHGDVRYKCDQCDIIYTTYSGLYRHQKSVHENIRYNCDQCFKSYTGKGDLRNHILAQHELKALLFPCDKCDKSFKSSNALLHHDKKVHRKIQFSCEHCGKSYTKNSLLNIHIDTKHNGIELSLKCKYENCDQTFRSYASLYYHTNRVHKKMRYSCKQCCSLVYISRTSLWCHMKTHHQDTEKMSILHKKV